MIKLMAREEGITVTELAKELDMDRWSVKYMIANLEDMNYGNGSLLIQEQRSKSDKRKTIYKISPDSLWTLDIPALNPTDDESALMDILREQSDKKPSSGPQADSPYRKNCWLENRTGKMVRTASDIEKIAPPIAVDVARVILEAIRNDKCIAFDYPDTKDNQIIRNNVLPLYIFLYGNSVYLNAQILPKGQEVISFAIDKMINMPETIEIRQEELPDKLEYDRRLEDPFGPFWDSEEFEFEVEFDAWQGWYVMHQVWPSDFKIEKLENGNVLFTAKARWRYGVAEWINKQIGHVISVKPEDILSNR